jgi:hypothetical protein
MPEFCRRQKDQMSAGVVKSVASAPGSDSEIGFTQILLSAVDTLYRVAIMYVRFVARSLVIQATVKPPFAMPIR